MKIAGIDVLAVRAPRSEPVVSGRGTSVTASEFGVIRIQTDGGLEGLGEISITFPRVGFTLCHAARRLIVPELLGQDPLQVTALTSRIDRLLAGEISSQYLRAAFEMALMDIVGKRYGVPLHQLLGGRRRERIPLAWGIYQKDPEDMAADAAGALEDGFHAIKMKIGRQLSVDVAAVRAVSATVGGKVPLRLDANGAWASVSEAATAIRALSRAGDIAWVEQPLPSWNLRGMHELRRISPVPIMADESVQSLRDAFAVASLEAADLFNVYVAEAGGPLTASQLMAFAGAVDVPCIIGSQAELGIGTAAAAHLGVSVESLPHPCETFGPLRYRSDVVRTTPRIESGYLYAPGGPGLGVELDPVALAECVVDE